jgi:hypothetical protein
MEKLIIDPKLKVIKLWKSEQTSTEIVQLSIISYLQKYTKFNFLFARKEKLNSVD